MRLTAIKLAGFKSFVDPTTFPLEADRVAIVGPNGCGKSNIIDAVRWVLGESSARQLRGGAMADVIFNGTRQRQPVGQATIELVFNNESQRLSGPWGQYAEIAVKRQVHRNGQSQYFINQQKVRRRDVTDLFLGTGLGPRSYAIIEQGMISRIIEARAEALQTFIEEAAGVSKYKERRRETEQHLTHTRENLTRLEDVRQELGRQLNRLHKQAKHAEKYQQLQAQARQLNAWVWARRYRKADQWLSAAESKRRRWEHEMAQYAAQSVQQQAEIQGVKRILETQRHQLDAAQQRWFALQGEIQNTEQSLRHRQETQSQRQQQCQRLQIELQSLTAQYESDATQWRLLEEQQRELEPQCAAWETAFLQAMDQLTVAERCAQQGQAAWEAWQASLQGPQAAVSGEKARIEALERQIGQQDRRRERLKQEREALAHEGSMARLAELNDALAELDEEQRFLREELAQLTEELAERAERVAALERQSATVSSQLQQQQGQFAALETLQHAALGEGQEGPLLADQLTIAPDQAARVEGMLGGWATARCVENLAQESALIETWQQGDLRLIEAAAWETCDAWGVPSILSAGAVPIDTLANALQQRDQLAWQEFWVTADGICVGRHWVRRHRGGSSGVIARKQALNALSHAIAQQVADLEQLQQQLDQCRQQVREGQFKREQGQRRQEHLGKRFLTLANEQAQLQARFTQNQRRQQALAEESADLESEWLAEKENLALAQMRLAEYQEQWLQAQADQEAFQTRRSREQSAVHAAKTEVERIRQHLNEVKLQITRQQRDREALKAAQHRGAALCEQRQHQLAEWQGEFEREQAADRVEREHLAELKFHHEDATQIRNHAREAVEQTEHTVNQQEAALIALDQQINTLRQSLDALQREFSDPQALRQSALLQLDELGISLVDALTDLPADEIEEGELATVRQQLNQLGAVNLAAIEEYHEVSERKTYLDAQHQDLTQALRTLETAIRQIDHETETRFNEMFNRINEQLSVLFPVLFGGGTAKLSQVSEGVAILAQPPGKRIGQIQQLSGGEKALTAVALVFAIFQLNPAPFCLLDEVDAPLDEANVGRFGQLLRDMSNRVQLIFITHNKATMETAQQLIGVTMQEPGVSRLVAVKVEPLINGEILTGHAL